MGNEKLLQTIVYVVNLLVQGKYDALEALSEGNRLSAEELRQAVTDYGHRLVMPPIDSLNYPDVVTIRNSNPVKWSVNLNLWTIEEGRSDLTLELTLTDSPDDLYLVEVDDLHVL